MKEFIALIHRDTDGTYHASFPDFPDVTAAGGTIDDARVNAEWALFTHIRSLEEGEEIPEPLSLASCLTRGTKARRS